MIRLVNVDKFVQAKFSKTFILKGIDMEIKEGEFVTIMGPSGAGSKLALL